MARLLSVNVGVPREITWRGKTVYTTVARAGLTVCWDPKFQSLLELAEACDVPVRWSCRTGVCHTCECGLISGSVTYDPEPLEPPAAGNLLICCSRPREDLAIDIWCWSATVAG